jgi:hypothetical protein
MSVRTSLRNVIPVTARRALARAMMASATMPSSTAYCESRTSCRSSCICRCILTTHLSAITAKQPGAAARLDKRWIKREVLDGARGVGARRQARRSSGGGGLLRRTAGGGGRDGRGATRDRRSVRRRAGRRHHEGRCSEATASRPTANAGPDTGVVVALNAIRPLLAFCLVRCSLRGFAVSRLRVGCLGLEGNTLR